MYKEASLYAGGAVYWNKVKVYIFAWLSMYIFMRKINLKAQDIEEYKDHIKEAKRLKLAEAKVKVFKNFIEKL